MVNANLSPVTLHLPSSTALLNASYDALQKFLAMMGNDQLIQILLHCDRNYQIVDKWLIAIVFEYFLQAQLLPHQYDREKFFLALYLAIEFEEDEDRKVKDVLLDYLLQHDSSWSSKRQFVKKKDKFWKKLGFQCMVARRRLEQIISLDPYHGVWQRTRKIALAGASRSFSCKINPPSIYNLQWPLQLRTHETPEVIDLTQDSPPIAALKPLPPNDRRKKSAAYRHLHSIVTLIEHDRGRRRPPPEILKMKHAQQKRLNELHVLDTLARSTSFTALGSELAHLSMNNGFSSLSNLSALNQSCLNSLTLYNNNYSGINQLLYSSDHSQDYNIPGLILLPDRRVSYPVFNMDLNSTVSPAMPMIVPVIPRADHWV